MPPKAPCTRALRRLAMITRRRILQYNPRWGLWLATSTARPTDLRHAAAEGRGWFMRLSTRFAAAIIAHVGVTVAVFSALNYRVFEVAGMPGAAERFASLTKGLADDLQASTAGLRVDIAGLRAAPAVDGIARASLNGGVDPTDGTTLAAWRAQLASTCVATLKAQPDYRRCRLIAVGQGLAHDIAHDIVT